MAASETKNVQPEPAKLVIYESQRYYPIRGWSDKLLPTDRNQWTLGDLEDGKGTAQREDVTPPTGYEWAGEWAKVCDENTDKDGWQYAMDFGWSWQAQASSRSFVRQRQWLRHIVLSQVTAATTAASPMQPVDENNGQGGGVDMDVESQSVDAKQDEKALTTEEKIEKTEKTLELYTFENQRHYISAWSPRLLPTDRYAWSSADGKTSLPKTQFKLEKGYKWKGNWRVVAGQDTDFEGWQYAVDFGWSWESSQQHKTFVRRRKWARTMIHESLERESKEIDSQDEIMIRFKPEKLGMSFNAQNQVTDVSEGSQAMAKGVKVGWVISTVNGKRIPSGNEAFLQIILKNFLSLDGDVDIKYNKKGLIPLSEEENRLVTEFFECLDLDGNGWIDIHEAKKMLHSEYKNLFQELGGEMKCSKEKFFNIFIDYKNRPKLEKAKVKKKMEEKIPALDKPSLGATTDQSSDIVIPVSPDFDDDGKSRQGELTDKPEETKEEKVEGKYSSKLAERLAICIAHVQEETRKSRLELEEKMFDQIELNEEDEDESEEEEGESEPRYWPIKKPIQEKKPFKSSS